MFVFAKKELGGVGFFFFFICDLQQYGQILCRKKFGGLILCLSLPRKNWEVSDSFFFHLRLATVWPNFVPQEVW